MCKYVVGFTVIDARNLQTEDGQPCDPFVLVECCGARYQTATKEQKAQHVPWNEAHVWGNLELRPDEFESTYIEFSVYARHWFTRNFLIGKASLQLASINARMGHVYSKKSLSIRKEGITESRGTLALTVFVLKSGEAMCSSQQHHMREKSLDNLEDLSQAVLGAAAEAPQSRPYHLHISIYRAEGLAQTGHRNPDPFVTVEFAGACVKTTAGQNVDRFIWNETARIPVQGPVYEDSILVKLWSKGFALTFQPDELLAQGVISFSELRMNSLPPRWFCLYGWNLDDMSVVQHMLQSGASIQPNTFKGRLLLAGRVERLALAEEMLPAGIMSARSALEPPAFPVTILTDIYEVCGVKGRECCVEVAFGSNCKTTKDWATPSGYDKLTGLPATAGTNDEDTHRGFYVEDTTTFLFSQTQGQIDPVTSMEPDHGPSRPLVIINVYTRGVLSERRCVGYQVLQLEDLPLYDPHNHAKLRNIALAAMPDCEGHRVPASLLMSLERHVSGDICRKSRQTLQPMMCVVRSYVFLGRNIVATGSLNCALRISCGGISTTTVTQPNEVRPQWMTCLELKVSICSDHVLDAAASAMDPITLTLTNSVSILGSTREVDLGKAVHSYQLVRRKDAKGRWVPYRLQPKWIQLFGSSSSGGKVIGEVLIAFEVLQFKHLDELPPMDVWPALSECFEPQLHFSKLKKATLHFALYGLRDLIPVGGLGGSSQAPHVRVGLLNFDARELTKNVDGVQSELTFEYHEVAGGGSSDVQEDRLLKWKTDSLGHQGCRNYEMFQVKKMNVLLPDKPILEPYLSIRVFDKQLELFGYKLGGDDALVGESLQPLHTVYPCCWYSGSVLNEASQAEQLTIAPELQEQGVPCKEQLGQCSDLVLEELQKAEQLNASGLPFQLQPFSSGCNPDGYKEVDREALQLKSTFSMNMKQLNSFPDRLGERSIRDTGSAARMHAGIDKSQGQDFLFKSAPLLRNHDVINSQSDETDWNFQHGSCFGFVKCAFKLTDGWDGSENDPEHKKLQRPCGLPDDIDSVACDSTQFLRNFKCADKVPSHVRVRLYFVRAVCTFGAHTGGLFGKVAVNPYLAYRLGSGAVVCMRSMVQLNTHTPTFYRVEERDISLPEEARLQVDMFDYQEGLGHALAGERLIGSTIIDLEDRWHSAAWRECTEKRQRVPIEHRPLINPEMAGEISGNIEMWIEMIDSERASDIKASELQRPASAELEVRLVIRTCSNLKLMDGVKTDVKAVVELDCAEYMGSSLGFPNLQATDTHYGSTGAAVFNWRVVFPRIVMPTNACTMDMKLYQVNTLAADQFIGAVSIDLQRYIERVALDMDAIYLEKAELQVSAGSEGHEVTGHIQFEMWVMTQSEANGKRAGLGRGEPNEWPQLVTPTDGRSWGDVIASVSFKFPDFGIWRKVLPLIVFTLICLVILKWIGLL